MRYISGYPLSVLSARTCIHVYTLFLAVTVFTINVGSLVCPPLHFTLAISQNTYLAPLKTSMAPIPQRRTCTAHAVQGLLNSAWERPLKSLFCLSRANRITHHTTAIILTCVLFLLISPTSLTPFWSLRCIALWYCMGLWCGLMSTLC